MTSSTMPTPPHRKHVQLHSSLRAEQVIASLVRQQLDSRKSSKPVLIAIGGPGGTGKSSFAARLSNILNDSAVLSLDNYKTSRQARKELLLCGPHPEANMMDLIEQHLYMLKKGEPISVPIYDRRTGDTGNYESLLPHTFIIVEGEISTYQRFHHLIDLSIFIDSDLKTQLSARMNRDVEKNGFSYEKAVSTFLNSNLKEFIQHGAESKEWSDIHCYCHTEYQLEIEAVSEHLIPALSIATQHYQVMGIQGLIVPITTPFAKNGDINQQAFITHLEWLYNSGVHRVLIGGTTGEFFSLTTDERIIICNIACRYFPGIVLFQTGCDGIRSTISLLKSAIRAGIDGVFCLPPYYFRDASEDGLVDYFNIVAAECTVPLYLYNFPAHTGNVITKEVLMRVPHAGLKDSSGTLELSSYTPVYFTGSEKLILDSHERGGKGYICGIPNVNPKPYIALENALLSGDKQSAKTALETILSKKPAIPGVSGIALAKAILTNILPGYPPFVRPPLIAAHEHQLLPQALALISHQS